MVLDPEVASGRVDAARWLTDIDRKLASPRIRKSEQTSAGRFHHEVRLTSPSDVDEELAGWLKTAYALSG